MTIATMHIITCDNGPLSVKVLVKQSMYMQECKVVYLILVQSQCSPGFKPTDIDVCVTVGRGKYSGSRLLVGLQDGYWYCSVHFRTAPHANVVHGRVVH